MVAGSNPAGRATTTIHQAFRRRPTTRALLAVAAGWMTCRTRWQRTGADEEARAALLLGQMVHDRRTELGRTQPEPAESTGMTQPRLSRLESGGATPAVPLPARLAAALDAGLGIAFRRTPGPPSDRPAPGGHSGAGGGQAAARASVGASRAARMAG
ncbi:helix-turn-helix domain-containing protein [Actinoplanes sp. NPDC020271]|uniref:helix-turn-helix domain-containing protein n=1 Tax=Actinoplanes sp. NPDC020271 TaxID=3363896 RepID=UPI0037B74DD8